LTTATREFEKAAIDVWLCCKQNATDRRDGETEKAPRYFEENADSGSEAGSSRQL